MGLSDLSHMHFMSTFYSLRLPLHLALGRLSKSIRDVLSNRTFTQNQQRLRSMAFHHIAISLFDTKVDVTRTPNHDVACSPTLVVIVIFRAIKLQKNHSQSQQVCTCSHADIKANSMLGTSRRNMLFDFHLGRYTSDHNNIGSLNLNRFTNNACINNLAFNRHDLQLRFW